MMILNPALGVFLTGLTLGGLFGSAFEIAAGARLSFAEPFFTARHPLRSVLATIVAGPFMLWNDATGGWRRSEVTTPVFLSCLATALAWVCASGMVAVELVSQVASILS